MSIEIRPAREEEMEQFRNSAGSALMLNSNDFEAIRPGFNLCAFEDGKLATTYGSWPLTLRFNGKATPVAGITTVGTNPIYRRRGNLRSIITRHFEMLHEEGERSIAILYASMAAIYQRYGYGIVSTQNRYRVHPRFLQFSYDHPVPGTLRDLDDDQFPLLVDLYRKFRAERTGYVHRGRAMWDAGVLAPSPAVDKQKAPVRLKKIGYYEDGEALGYVIYTIQPGAPPASESGIQIRDLIWLSLSAYRAFWNHFAPMDLLDYIAWGRVPVDDPLPHMLLEPRMLQLRSSDGLLGRIVDVDRAVTERVYTKEAALTFEVLDDLCPWNRGRWKLETSSGESTVTRTDEEPQLVIPISTLAMLLFGQISASEAARMVRLDVRVENSLSTWDSVMRTKYRPFCADEF